MSKVIYSYLYIVFGKFDKILPNSSKITRILIENNPEFFTQIPKPIKIKVVLLCNFKLHLYIKCIKRINTAVKHKVVMITLVLCTFDVRV